MTIREAIDGVLGAKKIAIAGVSRKETKFGSVMFRELKDRGMNVVGLNPEMDSIQDRPCYHSVEELPDDVESLITVVKPEQTLALLKSAEKKGIRKIWMQQGSASAECVEFCRSRGLDFVENECVMMYCEPVKSIHRFHRGINRLFGRYHISG